MSDAPTPAAGWRPDPDPDDPTVQRYWDGALRTDERAVVVPSAKPVIRARALNHVRGWFGRLTGLGWLALVALALLPLMAFVSTGFGGGLTMLGDVVAADAGPAVRIADGSATQMTALALLDTLPVKGRAPKTGYDREAKFGTAWLDVERNGCDTRNDILARDLEPEVKSGPCKVTSGTLLDPYTGKTIDFVRGNTTSLAVQVDHVVSLMNSWETGAQQLTQAQRISLANDPINLFAVDGPTNGQKGAGDAATWLPPKKDFRCTYVAHQVSVKATYGLWVTQPEHDAISRILSGCPDEPAVTSGFTPAAPPAPAYSGNCDAVRAAGSAPIQAGDPGYSLELDRDGDGRACE